MRKPKYPLPPRSMCSSWIHFILGIHSPSRELYLRTVGPKNRAEVEYLGRIRSYHKEMDRYKICTRTMTREEWKRYYRAARMV